jgi:hypothetical protein
VRFLQKERQTSKFVIFALPTFAPGTGLGVVSHNSRQGLHFRATSVNNVSRGVEDSETTGATIPITFIGGHEILSVDPSDTIRFTRKLLKGNTRVLENHLILDLVRKRL